MTLGGGQRSNIIKFRLTCQFQRFYTKLCVCCTNERYKDFHSVTLVMPQGSDFGALRAPRVVKKNSNMVMWHIKSTGMTSRSNCK